MAIRDQWVYFDDDSTAVRLDAYRKDEALQKRPVRYVIDTATGERTEGKPKVVEVVVVVKGAEGHSSRSLSRQTQVVQNHNVVVF